MRWKPDLDYFDSFAGPLSRASLPLLEGLARRAVLRGGAGEASASVGGVRLHWFKQGPDSRSQTNKSAFHNVPFLVRPSNTNLQPDSLAPVVLVHGLADSALTWSLMIKPLARRHQVYAVDLPGYGWSSLPAGQAYASLADTCDVLVEFLREVVGRPAVVVGNSLGGWLAVKLAQAAGDRVCGVVLLNPGGAPLAGRAAWEPFLETISVRDLRAARQVMRQMFGAVPLPLLYLGQRALQEQFQRQVVREFVAAVQENEFLAADELRQLKTPGALVWGLADTFLPAGSLEFFRDNLAGAPTLLLKRCGHLPQRERPLDVARFVETFAATHANYVRAS